MDSADARSNYLDGGEYAGAPLEAAADFGLPAGDITDARLADAVADAGYAYYVVAEIVAGDLQLRVSLAGAGNTAGLDADRIYPIAVTAVQGAEEASNSFGVWLDAHTLSPDGDGRCP